MVEFLLGEKDSINGDKIEDIANDISHDITQNVVDICNVGYIAHIIASHLKQVVNK